MKILIIFLVVFLYSGSCRKLPEGAQEESTRVVATGFDTPWEILWGPDDYIWITERPGKISRVDPETGEKNELLALNNVHEQSESGLMGMVLHPRFEESPFVYIAYNYSQNDKIFLRIAKYTYSQGLLISPETLIENIDGNSNHNGCRLIIGKDEKLYITTGDAQNSSSALDMTSLSGKVLRMELDGSVPADNPIPGSFIWSWGHRNAQGFVQAPSGIIYSSEHGPANNDELNIIEKGRNYGWPEVHGFCDRNSEKEFCEKNNAAEPIAAWTPTLAVAGIDFYYGSKIPEWQNSILMTSLKASKLVAIKLNENGTESVAQTEHLNSMGRLRDICISPDGRVFIATSNKDGRGLPATDDDRIIEILTIK